MHGNEYGNFYCLKRNVADQWHQFVMGFLVTNSVKALTEALTPTGENHTLLLDLLLASLGKGHFSRSVRSPLPVILFILCDVFINR